MEVFLFFYEGWIFLYIPEMGEKMRRRMYDMLPFLIHCFILELIKFMQEYE
jgi:hypothetical protein